MCEKTEPDPTVLSASVARSSWMTIPSSSGWPPLREGHFSQLVLTSSHNSGKQGWECIASASSSAFHLQCPNNPSDGKWSTHVRFYIPLTVVFVAFVSNTCAEADLSFGLSHICVSHVLHTALTSTRKLFFFCYRFMFPSISQVTYCFLMCQPVSSPTNWYLCCLSLIPPRTQPHCGWWIWLLELCWEQTAFQPQDKLQPLLSHLQAREGLPTFSFLLGSLFMCGCSDELTTEHRKQSLKSPFSNIF